LHFLLPKRIAEAGFVQEDSLMSTKPWHPNTLQLERLECRAVPAVVEPAIVHPPPVNVFLAAAYQIELGRPIDNAGLNFWRTQMDQGATREQVMVGILNSDEFINREIVLDYNQLLGRAPDAAGLQTYVQAMHNGATPEQVRASILGSDEFFKDVGSNSSAYLNAVYQMELGRPVDGIGESFWASMTGSAAGRALVAQSVATSVEGSQHTVSVIYADLLARTPDAGGMAFWAARLEQGQSENAILSGVFGSDEFFTRMQSFSGRVNTLDPNVAAKAFVTHANIVAPGPTTL
jgi:hypothetical protein